MAHAKESAQDSVSGAFHRALERLASGRYEDAQRELHDELARDPSSVEAAELSSVVDQLVTESRPRVEVLEFLTEGTAAFTAGQRRDAIEAWKLCLIEEPENRRLQLLVLMSSSDSTPRRALYAEEVLSDESGILDGARPEETEALLLLAQTVETPTEGDADTVTVDDDSQAAHAPTPSGDKPQIPALSEVEVKVDAEVPSSDTRPSTPTPVLETRDSTPPAEHPKPVHRAERREPRHPRPRPKRGPWIAVGMAFVAIVVVAVGLSFLLSDGGVLPLERMDEVAGLVTAGQYAEAIQGYDALLAEYGESAEVLLARGRAQLAHGSFEEGLSDLERALTLTPGDSSVAEEIGDLYYAQNRFGEARDSYRRAITTGAVSAEALYRLAVSLIRSDDTDGALEHLDAVNDRLSEHGEAQFLYGQLLNQRGRYEEAETALRASETRVEAGGDYLSELTLSLLGQDRLDAAEETARHFMQLYPAEPRARAFLGEIYLGRQQFEQARAELIQALRMDRSNPRAQIALARTWLAIGRTRGDARDLVKAREVLTTARGVDEGARLATLGQVALEEGDLESAERLLGESLDHGAQPLPVYLALADAKARSQDLPGAAEALRLASESAPADPSLSLSLAVIYSRMGEAALATEHFLETLHGIGLVNPSGEGAGPVVLPFLYVPLPERYDVNRAIRSAYDSVLSERADDAAAIALKELAENATFTFAAN